MYYLIKETTNTNQGIKMFKSIILLVALITATASFAATKITCAKISGQKTSYPMSEGAIKIALELNVKTCTRGRKFKKFLKKNDIVVSNKIVSRSQLEVIRTKFEDLQDL